MDNAAAGGHADVDVNMRADANVVDANNNDNNIDNGNNNDNNLGVQEPDINDNENNVPPAVREEGPRDPWFRAKLVAKILFGILILGQDGEQTRLMVLGIMGLFIFLWQDGWLNGIIGARGANLPMPANPEEVREQLRRYAF